MYLSILLNVLCSLFFKDVRLKVMILELLSVCVDTQPGLIEMFLNVQLPTKSQNDKQQVRI